LNFFPFFLLILFKIFPVKVHWEFSRSDFFPSSPNRREEEEIKIFSPKKFFRLDPDPMTAAAADGPAKVYNTPA
jgi:hypothetical protein